MSRSASVLVAWMMVSESLSVTEAMEELQRLRPATRPNDGFIRQLKLFDAMGRRVDSDSSRYRYFSILHGSARGTEWTPPHIQAGDILLKCSKCRSVIASQQQFLPHTQGKDPDWCPQELESETNISSSCQVGIFIVDVALILQNSESSSDRTQKFNCIKCHQKLGNIGIAQCPCGSSSRELIWMNLSKVDKSYKR